MADQAAPMGSPEQTRFGDLFNLVCDPATLLVAWGRVKRNRGSRTAGVDGQTRNHVEQMGVGRVLDELRQEIKSGTYRPLPARERLIPKRSGKLRSLGIPPLRDRIIEMAAKLEPRRLSRQARGHGLDAVDDRSFVVQGEVDVARGVARDAEDRELGGRDVAVAIEAEAAQDAVLDPSRPEFAQDGGARPVGAGDRLEDHLCRLDRVEQVLCARRLA